MKDKLARQNNEAFRDIAFEKLKAVVKQLHKFARKRERGLVGELARRVEGDSCLGGVRNDKPHFGLLGQFQVGIEIFVRVNAATHNVNQINGVNRFAAVKSLKVKVIKTVLSVKHLNFSARSRLHHHRRRVEIGLLIGFPDNPIRESAQKIPLAKLNHLFGVGFGARGLSIKLFQSVSRLSVFPKLHKYR